MTQSKINELTKEIIKKSQEALTDASTYVLKNLGISYETALRLELGVYTPDIDDLLTEVYVSAGLSVENIPELTEHSVIVPIERGDKIALTTVSVSSNSRASEFPLNEVYGKTPLIVGPGYNFAQTVYIADCIADMFALCDAGETAVYVQINDDGHLDISELEDLVKTEGKRDFIVTRYNEDDEKTNQIRARDCRAVGAVLSILGKEKYKQAKDSGQYFTNCYDNVTKFYKTNPDEFKTEVVEDVTNANRIRTEQIRAELDNLNRFERSTTFLDIRGGSFSDKIRELSNRQIISTGIKRLDDNLGGGIMPGSLYVIGAAPSTGKTSFCVQLADEFISQGYNVIFVSLEQTATELEAKSISRISYEQSGYSMGAALTSSEILFKSDQFLDGGAKKELYEAATQLYHLPSDKYDYADTGRLFVIRNKSDIATLCNLAGVTVPGVDPEDDDTKDIYGQYDRVGVKELRALAEAYNVMYGNGDDDRKKHPVYFIDYLQIMKPETDGTDKQNADLTISGLRRLVADYGVSLFAISSLNRTGYTNETINVKGKQVKKFKAPTMANLKESGGIEYGADVVLVLYDKGRKDAKRTVYVKTLKNRNGPTGRTSRLNYYPAFNTFSVYDLEKGHLIDGYNEIEDGDPEDTEDDDF